MCKVALQDQRTFQNQTFLLYKACTSLALAILLKEIICLFEELFKSGIGI